MRAAKVSVTCPKCGHTQLEPPSAYSSVCKKCREHFRLKELRRGGSSQTEQLRKELRRVCCFSCGTELDVPPTAQSTMCKRCSSYVDLHDYRITNAVSKNFKTKGSFVVEAKGYIFNTEVMVSDAVIKGRFLGKLVAERSLTIYSTADFKGSFKTGRLIIPAENHFRWKETIKLGSAEIAGELAASLHAQGTIILKPTARLFGDVVAGGLVVEAGAVLVGQYRVGSKKA
jgi:cytoskeletal protein CcmA (bactofilin family)